LNVIRNVIKFQFLIRRYCVPITYLMTVFNLSLPLLLLLCSDNGKWKSPQTELNLSLFLTQRQKEIYSHHPKNGGEKERGAFSEIHKFCIHCTVHKFQQSDKDAFSGGFSHFLALARLHVEASLLAKEKCE
jgi:hypothetical protein